MASPLYKVIVRLPRNNGVPEDDSVNVLHFEGDDDIGQGDEQRWEQQLDGLVDRVKTFYNAISSNFASYMSLTAHLQVINARDAKPVYARYEETWQRPVNGSAAFPAEVALCLSMEGARESGAVMRRRRGRIFLGPLSSLVAGNPILQGDIKPNPEALNPILDAAATMARGADDTGAARLAIYSPTTAASGGSQDAAWNDVERLWIDDAFDTMRSRGVKASSRLERILP